jgi:hypothetical protein
MNGKCRLLQNSWQKGDPTRVISTIKILLIPFWWPISNHLPIKVPHRPINRALLCRVFQIAARQQQQTRSFLDISPKTRLSIFGANVSRYTCPWPLQNVGSVKMDNSTKIPITQLIVSRFKFWIARNLRVCKARLAITSDLENEN